MPPAHRDTDPRVCGATTDVTNQGTVKVNGLKWAVNGDKNSHGSGDLIAGHGLKVRIEGIPVIVHTPDGASADDLCIPVGPPHCSPVTAGGSANVSCYPG